MSPPYVEVGMPATVGIGGDRYGCSITFVSPSGKTVVARDMKFMWKRVSDRYRWKTAGRRSGYGLYIGKAETYMDPSF